MNKFFKFLLRLTSIMPLSIIILIQDTITKSNVNIIYVIIPVIIIGLYFGIMHLLIPNNIEIIDNVKVKRYEAYDEQIVFQGFWLFPLIILYSNFHDMFGIYFVTVCLFLITCSGSYKNLVMLMFGWHFYKITDNDNKDKVLITRRTIRNAEETDLDAREISDGIFICYKK